MRTIVYVDGFNLYYRALRNTPFRWLDLAALCRLLLPRHQVVRIHYYTARVSAWPSDPDKPTRQQLYLRALATVSNLQITYGEFLSHVVKMPLAADPTQRVEVIRTSEKGSDVNLATHLLYEGMRGEFEAAAVLSNDSDLSEPVRIVAQELRKPVGILCPSRVPSRELLRHATFYKVIRRGVLAASQFPPTLTDAHGTFRKPASW